MNGKDFSEVVNLICRKDDRYDRAAYAFIREALDFTVKRLSAQAGPEAKIHHVSGSDLSEGARDYALSQYGPMAATLLRQWGITRTEDFGELVYNLVELEVFGTQEGDRREDFAGIYDFHEAFEAPFLPKAAMSGSSGRGEQGPTRP
ncbi:MAG: Minf_1886 family protein [Opitutales bacterium]